MEEATGLDNEACEYNKLSIIVCFTHEELEHWYVKKCKGINRLNNRLLTRICLMTRLQDTVKLFSALFDKKDGPRVSLLWQTIFVWHQN